VTVRYEQLAEYSDLVAVADSFAVARPGLDSATVRRIIGFDRDGQPDDPRVEARWSRDGVDGEEVSWSVGYGPRTRAWFLRPSAASGPLPGVLALHSHDGYKYHGKEKIADGPDGPDSPDGPRPELVELRRNAYQGRAYANELARRGFAVLVPDVFLWGSRRFALGAKDGATDVSTYNRLAADHEHVVAKYCTVLGTSLAGIVAYEDRIALAYLGSRPEVRSGALGCVGLSGGGCRAALLQATSQRVGAAVVVGMMSTYPALLDRFIAVHTWMFFPPNLVAFGDWPDLAGCRAPSPLLVQYLLDDALFAPDGMRAAHRLLTERYAGAGAPTGYLGEFYPGPHRFDLAMQESAFAFLAESLR
jgi:dienelactone hydrolase